MNDITKTLGHAVRDAREARGMSQRDMVVAMGFKQNVRTWMSKVENTTVVPTLGGIANIARVLGLSTSELILRAEMYVEPESRENNVKHGRSSKAAETESAGVPVGAMIHHKMAVELRKEIGRALGTLPKETR